MSQEIERKFIVTGIFPNGCSQKIAQGYLSTDPQHTVRIRIKGDKAFITIKGLSSDDGLSRYEWEKEIDVNDAEHLLSLCHSGVIEKIRYDVYQQGMKWEVDVFQGHNVGLVIAEVELESTQQNVEPPSWVGQEVTGDIRYYNSHLSKHPFDSW